MVVRAVLKPAGAWFTPGATGLGAARSAAWVTVY
jgi:hypothetical protein